MFSVISEKKQVAKMATVMAIVGICSGGILAGVYKKSQPLIERQKQEELKKAIFVVLPNTDDYEEFQEGNLTLYKGLDSQGQQVGIAFAAEGPGYQGQIKVMVGLNNELTRITGLKVLESVETPGLGGKITQHEFQNQFKGVSIIPGIEYVKNRRPEKSNQIQAITGATISSQAVVETVNQKVKEVLKVLGKEGDR